jgi:peptide/nickel transport system substrate-binding protein
MSPAHARRILRVVGLGLLAVLTAGPAAAQSPRPGGILTLRLREDLPQGFSIHESPTISTMWPAMPCLSNLVLFDPLKPTHSADGVVPELAERWSWQESFRKLVFFLRKDVKWHDGTPFTSRDVKATFDMLREAPDAPAKLRFNPRKEWWTNVEAVDAIEPLTVVIRLKRPQPSLLLMLASGYTPIYAAHLPPASYRAGCVGTGPFKLKEWRKGEFVEYVRNPDYFVKGRPYLEGLRYLIIAERATGTAAVQTGRVDATFPGDTPKGIAEQLRKAAPQLVSSVVNSSVLDHLVLNTKKPPFDNAKIRQAIVRAVDRRALAAAVYQGGATLGASMMSRPHGVWGLTEADLRGLPGAGAPAEEKVHARRLLAAAGFDAGNPLRVAMVTRNLPAFADLSSFVVAELKGVGIDVSLRLVDSSQWFALQARGEFQLAVDRSGLEPDDPDANFYEHYACESSRNYSGHCDPAIAQLIDRQSQELDGKKRQAMVREALIKLEQAAVRPALVWRLDYFTVSPSVKNLVPHHSIYGWGRLQDVWRDK